MGGRAALAVKLERLPLKMPPSMTAFYHPDQPARHTILGCDDMLVSGIRLNCSGLRFRDLRSAMRFTLRALTKPVPVGHIVKTRAPREVYGAIVALVPVNVAHFFTKTALTVECLRNNPVDVMTGFLAVACQPDCRIPLFANVRRDNLRGESSEAGLGVANLARKRPDAANIRNFILPFITGDRKPMFYHIGKLAHEARLVKMQLPWKDYP